MEGIGKRDGAVVTIAMCELKVLGVLLDITALIEHILRMYGAHQYFECFTLRCVF